VLALGLFDHVMAGLREAEGAHGPELPAWAFDSA
jgi:hypothetical protein